MNAPQPLRIPDTVPDSFFELPTPTLPRARPGSDPNVGTKHMRALILYDAVIDDILTHPKTNIQETAIRLGKAPGTISLVVRSDFFKARWAQRRDKFNEDLHHRITSKLAAVAEKSLESTLDVLKAKGDQVPLAVLNDINKSVLDRLGYAPSAGTAAPPVQVNVHNNAQSAAVGNAQASPEAVAKAREYLQILQGMNASSGPSPGPPPSSPVGDAGPVVEGESVRVEP